MKIEGWSTMHGVGTTASTIALSVAIAEQKNTSVLLTETNYNMNNMVRPLIDVEQNYLNDFGIDRLTSQRKQRPLSREDITDGSMAFGNELYVLPGTVKKARELYEADANLRLMDKVFRDADAAFDFVMIDTNSGMTGQAESFIGLSDVLVINLRQDRAMIDSFLELKEKTAVLRNKKIFYLFPDYDPLSRYSLFNIRRLYHDIGLANSGAIMHSAGYHDALVDGRVKQYLRGNLFHSEIKDAGDFAFFDSLTKTARTLVKFANTIKVKTEEGTVEVKEKISARRQARMQQLGEDGIG